VSRARAQAQGLGPAEDAKGHALGGGFDADTRRDLQHVAESLGNRVQHDHPFGKLTTYRVGGPAALYVEAGSEEDLLAVRRALSGRQVPILVLGKGSNMLVADAGFPGLVVHLGPGLSDISIPPPPTSPSRPGGPGSTSHTVRAGGGAGLPVLARRSVEAGLTGLEWAVGVPGSVGGAVRMNAGGHGSDVASCLLRYHWLDLAGDAGGVDGPDRLGLAYRSSTLSDTEVVIWAEFALRAGSPEAGRATLSEIVRWRREHQPGGSNAGSVFTNPPGDSAGRLVEEAGLKGMRMGSAQVSAKHANFIQADDGGSADDVRRLIDHVQRVVSERLGVTLANEVHLVGFHTDDNETRGTGIVGKGTLRSCAVGDPMSGTGGAR